MELSRLYGKNNLSPQKKLVMKGLKLGKSFATLAAELRVAQATAEVYGIDCLAAGRDLDDKSMAHFLDVNKKSFGIIKDTSMANQDKKLCTVRDSLNEAYSYNQICFVFACMIHSHNLD